MQIQVRINEEGALRNQRFAFTNRFTLVSELLQNARRAGATCIEIRYDAATQVLSVHDDGCGLEDFQKLLSFHESGWDAATAAEERPFGVGFSKCLYAATRCVVTSVGQRVDIDTEAALAKALITVEQVPASEAINGTRVDLYGVDLPDLGTRVEARAGPLVERKTTQGDLARARDGCGDQHPRPCGTGQPRCNSSSGDALGSPRSWHHFGRVGPDGCPGFKGPFPQPVSMSGAQFRCDSTLAQGNGGAIETRSARNH